MYPSQVSETARSWSQRENEKEREREKEKGKAGGKRKVERESQKDGRAERRDVIMHVCVHHDLRFSRGTLVRYPSRKVVERREEDEEAVRWREMAIETR